jgi:hypothetical protein
MFRKFNAIITGLFLIQLFLAGNAATSQAADSDILLKITGTDPTGKSVTLGLNQNFYVRVQYDTKIPTDIWVRPFFHGKEVPALGNASFKYSGAGDALGWFAFTKAAQVDEIRVKGDAGNNGNGKSLLSYPIRITASEGVSSRTDRAQWVDDLLAQEKELQKTAGLEASAQSNPARDNLFLSGFMLFMLLVLVCAIAAPAWALWRWRGGWRVGAAVPICLMAFVILRIIIDTSVDPTSHNLWPFEILYNGFIGLCVLAVLWFVRKLTLRNGI